MTTGYIKSHISFRIHTKQLFLKIMKNKKYIIKTTTRRLNNVKLKNNFYSMSEGNTCIAEPKLEVLLFA